MARRHSRKKGRHGSNKPLEGNKKTWMKYTEKEIDQLIIKLAKTGKQPSQIGMILRDSYGIYNVKQLTKKKIAKVVQEHIKMELPEDLNYLIKKQNIILKHLDKNKHDVPSKIGLDLTKGKILGLIRYYKKVGKLPEDWNYSIEQSKLITG